MCTDLLDLAYQNIDKWGKEYNINSIDIDVEITSRLREYKYLGLTSFKYATKTHRYCIVEISDKVKNNFLFTSVLWHEFCHTEPWIKDGISDGHSGTWSKRLWRKPIYAIGQWLAKVVY